MKLGGGRDGCEVRRGKLERSAGDGTGPSPSLLSGVIANMMDLCLVQFLNFTDEKTEVQDGP